MVEAARLNLKSYEKENDAKGAELIGYVTFFSLLRIENFLSSWHREGVPSPPELEEIERSS
jgi:hypothetical protein